MLGLSSGYRKTYRVKLQTPGKRAEDKYEVTSRALTRSAHYSETITFD